MPPGGTQNFVLFNNQPCEGSFSLGQPSASWLDVAPLSGTVGPNGTVTIQVSVARSGIPREEGTYSATFRVQGDGNQFTVTVNTTVGGQPPQILSASGTCTTTPNGRIANFFVSASDDVSVASVVVSWGSGSVQLVKNTGTAWSKIDQQVPSGNLNPLKVTVTDGSGKTATTTFNGSNCGGSLGGPGSLTGN